MNMLVTLRPKQNGWHFTDDIFKCIFLYENFEKNSIQSYSWGPNCELTVNGSDNGLLSNR